MKIEVGKKYRTRDGSVVITEDIGAGYEYRMFGVSQDDGVRYSWASPGYFNTTADPHRLDIIGEIVGPAPATPPESEGRKDDSAKIRYDLLPPEFLHGTADILTFGAAKYGDRNWERGMSWSRVFGALMRHMWAWWAGEKADPETGKSHLWHASCCLAFLIAYEQRSAGTDDRPSGKYS